MDKHSIEEFINKIIQISPIIFKKIIKTTINTLSKGQITFPQFLILDFLYREKKVKMNDIAKFLEVTNANATGLIERLVREKYIDRVQEQDDRRIIKVELTKKGKILIEKINKDKRRILIKIFSKLSQKDREDYLRILEKIREILEKTDSNYE